MFSPDKDFIEIIHQFLLSCIGGQINMNPFYRPTIVYGITLVQKDQNL